MFGQMNRLIVLAAELFIGYFIVIVQYWNVCVYTKEKYNNGSCKRINVCVMIVQSSVVFCPAQTVL